MLLTLSSPVNKRFGLRVRRLREKQGFSQEKLSELADFDRTYLSGIERGVRNPTLTVVARLAKAFRIPVSELTVGID